MHSHLRLVDMSQPHSWRMELLGQSQCQPCRSHNLSTPLPRRCYIARQHTVHKQWQQICRRQQCQQCREYTSSHHLPKNALAGS